jgi:hypothetical protein
LLAGCVAAVGRLAPDCSGVPGDLRDPAASKAPVLATHGPGAPGQPVDLVATYRPASTEWPDRVYLPSLFVFDDAGQHVTAGHPRRGLLADPVFGVLEKQAFWGEVMDDGYYLVPNVDKCNQASMFRGGLDFRAPSGGLLFVQYVADRCADCSATAAAIEGVIRENPQLPVRWIRVAVPRSIGSAHRK